MNCFLKAAAAAMLMVVTTALAEDAAKQAGSSAKVDGVAAYANAHVITYSDVLGASRELQQMVAIRRTGEDVNTLYLQVLNDLVNRKLIVDAYEDQKEIRIPEGVVEERAESVIREMFRGNRTEFLKALREDGLSETLWRAQIQEQMIVASMRNLRVDSQVRVSPLAVRERYEKDPSAFSEPEKVKFSMIVITKGDTDEQKAAQKEKLKAALASLAEGADFADIARRYSEDAMAEKGGERDWIEPDMLRKELHDLVQNSALGQVCEVLEIGPHYSLVKVQDRRPATRVPFEDAYARIERELRQEMSQRVSAEWTDRLRRDSFVRVLNESPF